MLYFNPRSLTGATKTLRYISTNTIISIHAPSRERPWVLPSASFASYFNPRSLTGATRPLRHYSDVPRYFNPRSLTGATTCRFLAMSYRRLFQSTLPHGSDFVHNRLHLHYINFNPRSLTGATTFQTTHYILIVISIHAPSRERH